MSPRTYADAVADQQLERRIRELGGAPYPRRITMALDAPAGGGGPLEGPDVDVACGAVEPAVDRWETGEEIPTRTQLERLARLTGYPLGFFFADPGPPMTGTLCIRSGRGRGCYAIGGVVEDQVPPANEQLTIGLELDTR